MDLAVALAIIDTLFQLSLVSCSRKTLFLEKGSRMRRTADWWRKSQNAMLRL